MNEPCKICGKSTIGQRNYVSVKTYSQEYLCDDCRDRAIADAIAKQPKEPTLEERVARYIADNNIHGLDTPQDEQAVAIVAMVREHDASVIDPSDNDHARIARLVEGNTKLKARAEAAEAKLAAIRSELST